MIIDADFTGIIDAVHVRPGDKIPIGTKILSLPAGGLPALTSEAVDAIWARLCAATDRSIQWSVRSPIPRQQPRATRQFRQPGPAKSSSPGTRLAARR